MDIVLGYNFDGGAYPDALGAEAAVAGEAVLGPRGLLSVLETRLGLRGPSVHPAIRVGQYLARLKAADGDRFYSKSFEADAWATANELLEWRDQLVIGGWDGNAIQNSSVRLKDLAAVEALPTPVLTPGFGERLRAVCQGLEGAAGVGINSVSLTENESFWPKPLQTLFRFMKSVGIVFKQIDIPANARGGDLALLQQCLKGKKKSEEAVFGDGSVILIVGQTEADAAEALADWLAADKDSNEDVLLIRGMGSKLLDEALHAKGLPRLGSESSSQWRAALQVLLLAFENAWQPVNPHLLLEILTLPNSPIPRWAGRRFENALRNHPGTGGDTWQEAWEKVLAEKCNRLEKEGLSVAKVAHRLKTFESSLNFWLGRERYDPEEGIPAESAQNICSEVALWAASRGGYEGTPLLIAAMGQATELAKAIKASNLERLTRPQLNRVVAEMFRFDDSTPGSSVEVAPWSSVRAPGQVWGEADTVIWWSFLWPASSHTSHSWTKSELKALSGAGVFVEEARERRLREALLWQYPVMMAGKKLLLVMHRAEAAEAMVPHPLWDEIRQAIAPTKTDVQRITVEAGDLRKSPSVSFGSRDIERVEVEALKLQEAKARWDIPKNLVSFREVESATSLDNLLGCPFAWVLNYHARIRMGALLSLPQGIQLEGILGHAVMEKLFNESKRWEPGKARNRAKEIYENLLPEMAAELLQPGLAVQRQRNRETIGDAAAALAKLLDDCSLTVVGSEQDHTKRNTKMGVGVRGILDLVLIDRNGKNVILDLKWTRTTKYRRNELREGAPVQLATYAWLLAEKSGTLPPAGYFMLAQGELLTSDVSRFPGQAVVEGPPLSEVWASVVAESLDKMNFLRSGVAEAPGADQDSGKKTKSCNFCDYGSLCGVRQEGRS